MKNGKLYLIFAFLSIIFYAIIAFPFAHRNESFEWYAILKNADFTDIIFSHLVALTYRPIAQLIAWLNIQAFGFAAYPIQIINIFFLCLAFYILFQAAKIRRLTSLLIFVITGLFFTSFYYIFNFHGLFYSPLLFYASFIIFDTEKNFNNSITVILIGIVLIFLHPLSLLLLLSYLLNLLLAKQKSAASEKFIPIISVAILVTAAILFTQEIISIDNFVRIADNTELNGSLTLFSIILSFIGIVNYINWRNYVYIAIAFVVLSILILYLNIPGLILLVTVILYKVIKERKWLLLFIFLSAVFYMLYVQSGAPTKAFLLLFISIFIIGYKNYKIEEFLSKIDHKFIFGLTIVIITLSILLRFNHQIPLISSLVNPLKIEKEKSLQIKEILEWKENSVYKNTKIKLMQTGYDLREDKFRFNRKQIPPLSQKNLDVYQKKLFTTTNENKLIITFGDHKKDSLEAVYINKKPNAGKAYVYLKK